MLAPIVIFTYNRIDHIRRLLSSLVLNPLCSETDVYVFADGPKSEDSSIKVKEVQEFISNYEQKSRFRSWNYTLLKTNNGLAKSVIKGVSEIIKKYGRVIVLEDDLVVSNDFLKYMNDSLDFYEKNSDIWSISGYTFPMKSFQNYHHDIYMILRGCSWGWATWLDRWEKVDWKVQDYNRFRYNLLERKMFSRGGNDLPVMLDTQMANAINSWAIRWCYQQFRENMFTVYPCVPKVINGGMDGSGTHSENTDAFANVFDNSKSYVLENIGPNFEIEQEFRSKYKRKLCSRIKTFIRYVILKGKI